MEDGMKLASVLGIAVVVASATAMADSTQEKMIRDQNGDPAAYTVGRIDRDGGDNCSDAPTITVATYTDSGNTTGYADDWGPTVSTYGQDGEDQAYLINLSAADTITVTVTPTGYDCSTYLIDYASCSTYLAPVLAGIDAAYSGEPETFSYAAAPGSYVVIVDSYLPGEVGPFTIEVLSNVPVELVKLTAD
jgi:hypothetical protein